MAKALKQDIERLRLAGEASPSGRAANGQLNGQPAGQRGNIYGHDQVCLYICVPINCNNAVVSSQVEDLRRLILRRE